MLPGESQDELTGEFVVVFIKSTYESFDIFVEHMFDLYVVSFNKEEIDISKATCTCIAFHDNFICIHVLCIG